MKKRNLLVIAFISIATFISCKKEIPGPKGDKGDIGDPGPSFKTYYFKSDFPTIGFQKLGDYDETKDAFQVYLMTDSFPSGNTEYTQIPCKAKAWLNGIGSDSLARDYSIKVNNTVVGTPKNLIYLDVNYNGKFALPYGQGFFKVVIFKGK